MILSHNFLSTKLINQSIKYVIKQFPLQILSDKVPRMTKPLECPNYSRENIGQVIQTNHETSNIINRFWNISMKNCFYNVFQ